MPACRPPSTVWVSTASLPWSLPCPWPTSQGWDPRAGPRTAAGQLAKHASAPPAGRPRLRAGSLQQPLLDPCISLPRLGAPLSLLRTGQGTEPVLKTCLPSERWKDMETDRERESKSAFWLFCSLCVKSLWLQHTPASGPWPHCIRPWASVLLPCKTKITIVSAISSKYEACMR